MVKGKDIIGRSVVGQDDGVKLGAVKDLIYDHETGEMLALVLADRDLFGLMHARIVPWAEVRRLGADAVLVRGAASLVDLQSDARVRNAVDRRSCLSGTKVYTSAGQYIGSLADMCIDEATGRVAGYELSEGFIADSLHGKKFLPAPEEMTFGHDAAVVSPAVAATIESG